MNARLRGAARLIGLLLLSTSVWGASIQKTLLTRLPAATPEELEQAHACVHGGRIAQDMGYYPFSGRFFGDLTHYVRSGDLVIAPIRESRDRHEHAFALGALSHYAADTAATGKTVTCWDIPLSHIRTEFSFDVIRPSAGYRRIGVGVGEPA